MIIRALNSMVKDTFASGFCEREFTMETLVATYCKRNVRALGRRSSILLYARVGWRTRISSDVEIRCPWDGKVVMSDESRLKKQEVWKADKR